MNTRIGIRSENELRLLEKQLIRTKLFEEIKNNPSEDPVLVLKEEVPVDSRYQTLIEEEYEDILIQKKRLNIGIILLAILLILILVFYFYVNFFYTSEILVEYNETDDNNYVELLISGYILCSSKLHCLSEEYFFFQWIYWLTGFTSDFFSNVLEFWLSAGQN